jgi:hypothetical protein
MICSHKECRGGGVKFLFCSSCGIPVAKKQFNIHHAHREGSLSPDRTSTAAKTEGQAKATEDTTFGLSSMDPDSPPLDYVAVWNSLLEARPPNNDREALLKWVEVVFTASARYQNDDEASISFIPDSSTIAEMMHTAIPQKPSPTTCPTGTIEDAREGSKGKSWLG